MPAPSPRYTEYRTEFQWPRVTPGLLGIIILSSAVFLLLRVGAVTGLVDGAGAVGLLGLVPAAWLGEGRLWQIVTYMVVHWDLMHIVLNLLTLGLMGGRIEERMGTARFLLFFALAGVAGGLACVAVAYLAGTAEFPIIGASAGLFGVLTMWALWWPEAVVLIMGVIPVKMKWLAVILIGGAALSLLVGGGGNVAHEGHLGGCVAALAWWHMDRGRSGGGRRKPRVKLRLVPGTKEQDERFRAIIDDL